MSTSDIFLSYAHNDAGVARMFAEAFKREGFNVWWDDELRSGQVFDHAIEAALRAAKAVVVLWSPHSVSSRCVRAEATLADRNRTLVPVTIAPCERPIIFELTHTADLAGWKGDGTVAAWQDLLRDIRGSIEKAPSAAPAEGSMSPSASRGPIDIGMPSLAIMPFANRSGEEADGLFATGLVDDLIAVLSTGQVKVISSSSTRAYRDAPYDARQVGDALGARYLLEGNVRRVGDDFRVTAQLVEASSGAIRWTQKFDRPLRDLARLQEDLVIEVASHLNVQVRKVELERALRKPGDLTAWESLLRSDAASVSQTYDGLLEGLAEARRAVKLAPDFAAAHARLAFVAALCFWQLSAKDDEDLRREAREHAKRALNIEANDPRILSILAQAYGIIGDWNQGQRCAEHAMEINPDLEASHVAMIMVCIYFKRHEEALKHIDACDRLAPRGMEAHIRLIQRAGAYYLAGDYERALETSRNILMMVPDFLFSLKDAAVYLQKLGRHDEAQEALRELRARMPTITLDLLAGMHKRSVLAPDIAAEYQAAIEEVWHAAEAQSAAAH
ncbi:MAG: TIR domain-containing protein [Croceibacterium sp.]